jgi:hypothetical protein
LSCLVWLLARLVFLVSRPVFEMYLYFASFCLVFVQHDEFPIVFTHNRCGVLFLVLDLFWFSLSFGLGLGLGLSLSRSSSPSLNLSLSLFLCSCSCIFVYILSLDFDGVFSLSR